MNRAPSSVGGLAVALLLLAAATTRADPIIWTYSWSRSPTEIPASVGPGHLELTEGDAGGVDDYSTVIVATNIKVHSTASSGSKDQWFVEDSDYTVSLYIRDEASGEDHTFHFSGQFQGFATGTTAVVFHDFTTPTWDSKVLGAYEYSVQVGWYNPPGPPSQGNLGGISALVTLTPAPIIEKVPEPSTLALGGLGLALLGACRCWRAGRS